MKQTKFGKPEGVNTPSIKLKNMKAFIPEPQQDPNSWEVLKVFLIIMGALIIGNIISNL